MDTVRVKYSGPKPRMVVALPVPFLAKSNTEGEVEFVRQNGAAASWAQVPAAHVEALCQPDGLFTVDQQKAPAPSGGASR